MGILKEFNYFLLSDFKREKSLCNLWANAVAVLLPVTTKKQNKTKNQVLVREINKWGRNIAAIGR